ncbi:MAG: hypothetical protein R3B47_08135 [Bacteroidia bacterium]
MRRQLHFYRSLDRLLPEGILYILIDDTVRKKSGKKIQGAVRITANNRAGSARPGISQPVGAQPRPHVFQDEGQTIINTAFSRSACVFEGIDGRRNRREHITRSGLAVKCSMNCLSDA